MKNKTILLFLSVILTSFTIITIVASQEPPQIQLVNPTIPDGEITNNNFNYVNVSIYDLSNTSSFIDWNRSLVGYWAMDWYNSTGIYDNSTYNNFGTFGGGIGTDNITDAEYGKGIKFNQSYFINCSNNSVLNPQNFTVEAWLYTNTNNYPSNYPRIVSKENATSANPYALELSNYTKRVDWCVKNSSTEEKCIEAAVTIAPQTWYHAAGTYNSTHLSLYINGNLSISEAINASGDPYIIPSLPSYVMIGNNPQKNRAFNGTIDEVKIWNRVLSAEEINASYNSGLYRLYNNFTNLEDGIYQYYAYSINQNGYANKTETRALIIDTTSPQWSNLNNNPLSPTVGQDVTIMANWSDNNDLNTVIFYENSSGYYQQNVCSLITHQCSGEEKHPWITNLFSIFIVLSVSFVLIVTPLTQLSRLHKTILYFTGIITIIILMSMLISPEISRNVSKMLRLGIITMEVPPTMFTHLIPKENITAEMTVNYYSIANDTAGNENMTEIRTFIVQPPPTTTSTTTTTTETTTTTSTSTTTTTSTTTSTTISTSDLIGYWKFDEGSGIDVKDNSTFRNNGTLGNGTCFSGSETCPNWKTSNCHSGYCLTFDGINDYVFVNNSLSLNSTQEITVLAWIEASSQQTNAWPRIACKGYYKQSGWCLLLKNDTNALRWEIFTPNQSVVNGTTNIMDDQWHHVAGSYDKKNLTIYVDGKFEANLTENADMINNDTNLTIGSSAVNWFNGTIDEVKIYNRALSAEEIKNEYQFGVPTTTTTVPPSPPTNQDGGGGGGGGGTTIQQTGFYNFTNIEIEIESSKTIYGNFFSRENLKNVSFNITGINESWFVINPLFIDETKSKEIVNISITFTIPNSDILNTYPIYLIAKSGLFTYKKGLNLTLVSKPVATTLLTTTITTTTPACISSGKPCNSNLTCCSRYCCDKICSEKKCETKQTSKKFNILPLVIVISIGTTVGFFVYKKYIKNKLIDITTQKTEDYTANFREEMISLRKVSQDLKKKGYDVKECENELNLAEDALNKNSKLTAIVHIDKATKIMEKMVE